MHAGSKLDRAAEELEPIEPFGDVPEVEDPYKVQADFVARRAQRVGSAVGGYKVALTDTMRMSAVAVLPGSSSRSD
jgi:2-keto-4-pentenoate hydratase